eukprot:CFRG1300T1
MTKKLTKLVKGDPSPRRTIVLTPDTKVEIGDTYQSDGKKLFAFTLSFPVGNSSTRVGLRNFQFAARTVEEVDSWVQKIEEAIQNIEYAKANAVNILYKAEGLQYTPAQIQNLLEANQKAESVYVDKDSSCSQGEDDRTSWQDNASWQFEDVVDGLTLYRQCSNAHDTKEVLQYATEFNKLAIMVPGVCIASAVLSSLAGVEIFASSVIAVLVGIVLVYFRMDRLKRVENAIPNYMVHQHITSTTEKVVAEIVERNIFGFQMTSGTQIEKINEYASIMRYEIMPVWLGFAYSSPRDVVVMRYWRKEENGSFIVLFQSTTSAKAPPRKDFVRASVPVAAVVVYPRKPELKSATFPHSMITMIIGYDPGSYASLLVKYFHCSRFAIPILKTVLRMKDGVYLADFIDPSITIDPHESPETAPVPNIGIDNQGLVVGVRKFPCSGQRSVWAEPDSSQFHVRGPNYLKDRVKIVAEKPVFHLVAVDLFSFADPSERINLCSRSDSLVSKIEKDAIDHGVDVPFTFVVNMIIPCHDNLAFVCYYQPTNSNWREENSGFMDLFSDFVDGDDAFRNTRFKLIPRIVDGSYILKKALGSKPAIIGNKGLTNPYFRGENWFEVDIDVNSDSHARNITGMVVGATKSLVIDIAFIIEAQSEEELPERVLGTVRLNRMDTTKYLRVPKKSDILSEDAEDSEKVIKPSGNDKMTSPTSA